MMQLSIIIPVFNEAGHIQNLVRYLLQHAGREQAEVIVSDGGSTDGTLQLALEAGAITTTSPVKGRAAQMNHGASMAKGNILYFLHADTKPPVGFFNDIMESVSRGYEMGRYRTRFDSRKWYLKINAWFTRFDWFICMGGDNSLFISRNIFESVRGFKPEMRIMEEYEFCERVRRQGVRYKVIQKTILVSARKYDTNSWWNVQLANRKIVSMYRNGASQSEMVETYRKMLVYR